MPAPRVIADRYEVLETLRSDERCEELRARDRKLAREVLLVRRVPTAGLPGKTAEERALREARSLAALVHPAVQKLHDVVADEAGPVLVLEPVEGETLAARLARDGKLAPLEVAALGVELAGALAALHAAGAVHRDVSSENVVLRPDGSACLTGFRLAKPIALGAGTSLEYGRARESGERGELPAHPAPEQLGGEAANARTDVFALGCVLYRALCGREAMPDFLERGWSEPADPARSDPRVSRPLAQAVLACLARSPIARAQSAAAVEELLRKAETAPRAMSPGAPGRKRSNAPWIGATALLLCSLGAWQLWPRGPAATAERGIAPPGAEIATRADGTTFSSGFRRAHALLIGIGEAYRPNGFAPLANAVRDVDALETALRAAPRKEWTTRVLRDGEATYEGIRDALAELEAALETEDRALIFFAGHGVPHETSGSSGWLIPADGLALERDPNRKRWLHFDALDRFLKDARAKHVLVALDCCYGGRLASTRAASARAFDERFLTRKARVVLAAGRSDEQVSDGGAIGHSPFAEVLLDALGEHGGAITSSMLHARMLQLFNEREIPQTPVLAFSEDPGEFVFFLE